jgi:hypothetical protein
MRPNYIAKASQVSPPFSHQQPKEEFIQENHQQKKQKKIVVRKKIQTQDLNPNPNV